MTELSGYISTYFETKSEQSDKIAALFQEESIKRNDGSVALIFSDGNLQVLNR